MSENVACIQDQLITLGCSQVRLLSLKKHSLVVVLENNRNPTLTLKEFFFQSVVIVVFFSSCRPGHSGPERAPYR